MPYNILHTWLLRRLVLIDGSVCETSGVCAVWGQHTLPERLVRVLHIGPDNDLGLGGGAGASDGVDGGVNGRLAGRHRAHVLVLLGEQHAV